MGSIERHSTEVVVVEATNDTATDVATLEREAISNNDAPRIASEELRRDFVHEKLAQLALNDQPRQLAKANVLVSVHGGDDRVLTDGDETPSLEASDVTGGDENSFFDEQGLHIASGSPEPGLLSDLSSEGGSDSGDAKGKSPDLGYSPSEASSAGRPADEEVGVPNKAESVKQHRLNIPTSPPRSKRTVPTIVPWRQAGISRSDIPPSQYKFPKSETSDLGDREFHDHFRATGRKSTFPSPPSPEEATLQDKFFDALIMPMKGHKGFIPRALLYNLVDEVCVAKELTKALETRTQIEIEELAAQICIEEPQAQGEEETRPPKIKSFKKVFVILVFCDLVQHIEDFLVDDVNDLDLPLVKANESRNGARFELRKSRMRDQVLLCFNQWDASKLYRFEEWQWATLSPFFYKGYRKHVPHFPLQDSIVLPYTSDTRRDLGEAEGGFASVFKVEIHEEHHNFSGPAPAKEMLAIKQLKSRDKEVFNTEVAMLRRFNDDAHPHLISLLATYEQFGIYNLVFPCAEGNLSEYWRRYPNPTFNHKTVYWVAKQCEGLADGLVQIHHYLTSHFDDRPGYPPRTYMRHGDLKPENILYFPDENGGTLKISDFGLAQSSSHSRSYKLGDKFPVSMIYRPPECDVEGGMVGQSYDIWTMGCLYLEFVTWLLGGLDLVVRFSEKRIMPDPGWSYVPTDTFFKLEHRDHAIVKPAVTEFIEDDIRAHEHCPEFVHDIVDLIMYSMMVVKSKDLNVRSRMESKEIHRDLAKMLEKCTAVEYACKPAPWRRKRTHSQMAHGARECPSQAPPGRTILSGRSHGARQGGNKLLKGKIRPFLPFMLKKATAKTDPGPSEASPGKDV